MGFVGRAFTWANSTALVVLIVFFFRADKRSEDNTTYLRESIGRSEARFDKYTDKADGRYDAVAAKTEAAVAKAEARADRADAKIESLSSEIRSLVNSITALTSEVRAGRQKAEAEAATGKAVAGPPPEKLKQVFREPAPPPRPAKSGG
jgi:chromosome segregation ATPase